MRGAMKVKAVLCVALFSVAAAAQQWSYSGTSMCYDNGQFGKTCYGSGTIRQAINSRDQFQQQVQTGQAIGSLAGTLARAWAAKHAQAVQERRDLREALYAYQRQIELLLDDIHSNNVVTVGAYQRLLKYDAENKTDYEDAIKHFWDDNVTHDHIRSEHSKNMATILNAKNKDFLRSNLATEQRMYDILSREAANDYAFSQFIIGYAGWTEYRWAEAHKNDY